MNQRTVFIAAMLIFAVVQESCAFTAGIGNMGINGKREVDVKVRWRNFAIISE